MNENLPLDPAVPPALAMPFIPKSAPALWNPNAAASWSILFTPAFGAYLHAQNARALGRKDEAKSNEAWFYGTLIFLAASLIIPFVPGLNQLPTRFAGLAVLLVWYFSVAKSQVQYVKDTYGDTYPRSPWGMPLVVGSACLVGLFMVAFILGFIVGMMSGGRLP